MLSFRDNHQCKVKKLQFQNREVCSQTVVIVDTMQIELSFQKKVDGLLWSAVVFNCKRIASVKAVQPFGKLIWWAVWTGKWAVCPFKKLNNLFSRSMNPFERMSEPFGSRAFYPFNRKPLVYVFPWEVTNFKTLQPSRFDWESPNLLCCLQFFRFLFNSPYLSWNSQHNTFLLYNVP